MSRSASSESPRKSCRLNVPYGPLADEQLDVVVGPPFAVHVDGQHVALDRQVEGVGADAGHVELDDEVVALAVGVDRHGGGSSVRAEDLLGDPVELVERIGAHQHVVSLR